MLSLLEAAGPKLQEVCRRRKVRRLEVFGSAVRNDFDTAGSDLDFLVEFEFDRAVSALETYFGLKEELETLFGRPIDLVMPGAVRNPYVRAAINRDRRLLYAA
jgi:predicted nucleotidyltransferase